MKFVARFKEIEKRKEKNRKRKSKRKRKRDITNVEDVPATVESEATQIEIKDAPPRTGRADGLTGMQVTPLCMM